ncbi:tRNA (guanosine(46)-N7)-methyltransferase TrmB [Mycoplasma phocoeninasale]|uniref:tRNA (guanine-N(7)-)-methyltransferase n=1 Tax=Mycoplasma phocoeninasale TaxID=2726117 RepID=A0A858U591_9MOLU|nr:tRNA (guanosine(46)-N7)-methyltransferase TrmB [Mycoplasma phocoeninasale]QJG66425.1 tRNA (guanosine(46)-N7)-methyltransferase TrmB [Mycoplasma phocoeninasale]
MRLRFNRNAEEIIKNSKFSIQELPYQINNESVLEIGMGKGTMLSQLAKNHPEITYIGLEKYSTPAMTAIKKIEELQLENMYILVADANEVDKYFEGKFKTIWLTFSDPWPKKRHYKRRLVYRDFLKKYKTLLANDGIIFFKSDNDGLYNFALEELGECQAKIIYKSEDFHNCNFEIENYFTDYERKFFNEGKAIKFIAFNFQK